MNKISIIIVNWNSGFCLEKCLNSIFQNAEKIELEVFVVDNNSTDGSLNELDDKFPSVQFIRNTSNLGFAKANNQAYAKSSGEFILLLNPDVEILPEALEGMVSFLSNHRVVGAVGPKMLDSSDEIQAMGYYMKLPTLIAGLFSYLSLQKIDQLFPAIYKKYFCDLDFDKKSEVEQIPGACLMVKREVIDKIGFLDERFFVWMEDVDFCYRIKKNGWKMFYLPTSQIKHIGGVTFNRLKKWEKKFIFTRSLFLYFLKNKGIFKSFLLSLIFLPKFIHLLLLKVLNR